MKVYLVGGAVRDQLLGYPIKERDWVIVGGMGHELEQQGYTKVGRDFPVYLHPKTREEYALARKERKKSPGYYGFDCDFSPEVSLAEDLQRRDLTINAMALDENGDVIDPYHGAQDLNNRVLRHVSPSFVEDPVRVLRVARFAARYHHLGFKLAPETRQLMYTMVRNGELEHLVPERVWQEWRNSLEEKNPEIFIQVLRSCGALNIILPELDRLFGIPNPSQHHPEIDSGIHTLMVLEQAVRLASSTEIRFAALVHDLGKGVSPMGQWPSHGGHERGGLKVIENLCERLRIPTNYNKLAGLVSVNHLHIHRIKALRANTIVNVLEQTDAFRRPERFEQLLTVCEADARGRGFIQREYPQKSWWIEVLQDCNKIKPAALINKGLQGNEIKLGLHELRVKATKIVMNSLGFDKE